jgi:hypothetical protein
MASTRPDETKIPAGAAPVQWKKVLLLIMIGGALLLTGCPGVSLDMEVTFYEGERWEHSGKLSLPEAMVMMMGGAGAVEDMIRSELKRFPGLDVSIGRERRDEQVVYHVTAKGEGWEMLNDYAFEGRAAITRRNGEIHIEVEAATLAEMDMVLASLTLHGGRVIDSNADQVTDGRATWYNPRDRIWVTLTEKRPGHGLIVPLIIFGLLAAGGVVAFACLAKRKSVANIRVPVQIACAQCGKASSSGDKFCQNCGSRL